MKHILLAALAVGTLVPMYAYAQSKVDVTVAPAQPTEAQVFTACSQTSIELRDSSIGSARTAYNNAMSIALDARKEAEKKAVALTEQKDKKDAIKVAVDDYKKAVTQAQEALIAARKEAWKQFEDNMNTCRTLHKDEGAAVPQAKPHNEARSAQSADDDGKESKSLKETLLESIRNFFKKD